MKNAIKWFGFILILSLVFGFALAKPVMAAPGDPVCVVESGECYLNIQAAITAALPGNHITVANGTYVETLDISKSLTITGASEAGVILDTHTFSDYGIDALGDLVTAFSNFTLIGPPPSAFGYGIKVSGDNAQTTIQNVTVRNSGRTGIDLNGLSFGTVDHVTVTNNGGVGLALTDSSNITVSNITSSGNAWGGWAVYTRGSSYPGGSTNITLSGTNSFAEPTKFYVQEENGFAVTNLHQTDFGFMVKNGTDFPGYYLYYLTQVEANAVATGATHPLASTITNLVDGSLVVVPGMSIQAAIDAALPGDTINVTAGTYVLTTALNVNKDVTLNGIGNPLIQVSGTGERIIMNTPGATLQGFQIEKTDKVGVQNIIAVNASNLTIQNNKIWGHYIFGENDISRAMVVYAGNFTGILITNNEISDLRQPAYISGLSTGMISNNLVYRTRGWVLEGGNLTFTGNTWGTGANANVYDIAIISAMPSIYYTDIVAMSAVNNNAFIEDQRASPPTLSIVYVDGSVITSGDGTQRSPKKTITEGITRIAPGGKIFVAPGTYNEVAPLVLNKANLTIQSTAGPSTTIIDLQGTGLYNGVEVLGNLGVVTFDGFTVKDFTQDGIKQSYLQKAGTVFHVLNNIVIPADNYLRNGIEVTGDGSTVVGNVVYGKLLTADWASCGIQVDDASHVRVLNNTVIGAPTTIDVGICVAAWDYAIDDVLIQANTVSDAKTAIGMMTGIYTPHVISNVSILNNVLSSSTTGIAATSSNYDGTTLVLTLSGSIKIENNQFNGILENDLLIGADVEGSVTLAGDAAPNWWGQNTGPTANDIVSLAAGIPESAISIYPYCTNPACTEINAPVVNTTKGTYFGSIQAAIDDPLTAAGDVITVAAGTYVGDLMIDKAVTLLGPNAAINPNTGTRVAEAIIHPSTSNPNPAVCTNMAYLTTSNITIKGFTFDGDNPALTSGILINGADVDACEILSGYEGMGHIVVENNILKNATYAGIDFYNYISNAAPTSDSYIRYNKIDGIGETTYNWGIGILVTRNFYADVTDNVITHTRVGIQADYHTLPNPGATGRVSNNQVSAWRLGLFLNQQYSNGTPLIIANNTFTAENYAGATNWSGILVSSIEGTANTTINGNTIVIPTTDTHSGYTAGYNVWNTSTTAPLTISGGTITGGDYGVYVNNFEGYGTPGTSANNTSIIIDGVTILGSDIAGIYVRDDTRNTTVPTATVYANILHSTIDTNSTGILVEGTDATAVATNNNLANNPTFAINNLNAGFTMNASPNWWGTAALSNITPMIHGLVTYQPYWVNAAMTILSSDPVTPVFVDDNFTATVCGGHICGYDAFPTLQGGIAAVAAGGTVNVAAGNYTEVGQIVIARNMTIVGEAKDTTIIRPDADYVNWFLVNSGVTLNLSQVTLDGQGRIIRTALRTQGSGSITDCVFEDIIFDTYNGWGIAIDWEHPNQVWSITNNTFRNIQRVGILVDGQTNQATISGNTFIGKGTGNWVNYGVEVGDGAHATISGNSFTGYQGIASTDGSESAGVMMSSYFGPNPMATITGNSFTNNSYGVMLGYLAADSSSATATGNTFTGNPVDIWEVNTSIINMANALANNTFDKVVTINDGSLAIYSTIQAAIDGAAAGDVIHVGAGTYIENVIVNKSVEIAGAGQVSVIVMPAISNPNCGGAGGGSLCAGGSNVFLVQANNVKIHDLTVDGDNPALTSAYNVGGANLDARNGIITNHSAGVFNNLEVYNTTVRNIYLRGIYASSNGSFNIHDNTVTNVQAEYASIAIFAYGGPGIIQHNTVSYANDGISANHSNGIQFLNNTVSFSGSGIHTDNSGDGGGVSDLISGNTVNNCPANAYGIWTFENYLPITIENNTVTGCAIGYSAWGSATTSPVQFTNNIATGPAIKLGSVGIYVTTDLTTTDWGYTDVYANFTGNNISGFETGIYLAGEPQIWNTNWTEHTIHSTFFHNQVTGSTLTVADRGATGLYAANLEANWWGSLMGPQGPIDQLLDYTPWCGDAACTFLVPDGTGTITLLTGTINQPGGFDIYVPHLTILLADGTVVQNTNAACFSVHASFTTILAQSIGGARCIPGAGHNGIDVAASLVNTIIHGIEFTGPTGMDGINFAGSTTDVQVYDNWFHDLAGDGIQFFAAPTGVVDIQGNLFQNNAGNGIEAGSAVIPAEYNSWGNLGGATLGDHASINVDADPWTHVDLYLASPDAATINGQVTYTVYGNLRNVMGAAFTLAYPTDKLELVGSPTNLSGFIAAGPTLFVQGAGTISFNGIVPGATPVSGTDTPLFRVTFRVLADGGLLDLVGSNDLFSMFPNDDGPSTNIYAASLVDTLVTVNGFSLTGTVSMQGRSYRGDVPATLTGLVNGLYKTYSINQLSNNLAYLNLPAGSYVFTTLQPRYLNIPASMAKTVVISGNRTLPTLSLVAGNAIWTDNLINIQDATKVGQDYLIGNLTYDSDVNFDGNVNILDLTLVGGNYGRSSTTAYGTWVP